MWQTCTNQTQPTELAATNSRVERASGHEAERYYRTITIPSIWKLTIPAAKLLTAAAGLPITLAILAVDGGARSRPKQ